MEYILIIKKYLFGFIKGIFKNLIMTLLSLLLTFFLYKLIEWLIGWHFENSFKQKIPLPVYIFHDGNDIDFDIINFDGENYDIVVDVDKFNPIGSGVILSNVLPPIRYNIWMNKSDVSFFDVIKLFTKTLCNKHRLFQKLFNKKTKLSHSTKSNLIRTLKNAQMI